VLPSLPERKENTMEMTELIINKLGEVPVKLSDEETWLVNRGRVRIQEVDELSVMFSSKETNTDFLISKDDSLKVWANAKNLVDFMEPRDYPMWEMAKVLFEAHSDRDITPTKGGPENDPTSLFVSLDYCWFRLSYVETAKLYKIEEWGEGDGVYYATSPANVIERMEFVENLWKGIERTDAEARFWEQQNAGS
jgi:hypothetical protein